MVLSKKEVVSSRPCGFAHLFVVVSSLKGWDDEAENECEAVPIAWSLHGTQSGSGIGRH